MSPGPLPGNPGSSGMSAAASGGSIPPRAVTIPHPTAAAGRLPMTLLAHLAVVAAAIALGARTGGVGMGL